MTGSGDPSSRYGTCSIQARDLRPLELNGEPSPLAEPFHVPVRKPTTPTPTPQQERAMSLDNEMAKLKLEPDPALPRAQRQSSGNTVTDSFSYLDEDGRTYHGWMAGEYSLPNDGEEQDRQDFQHALYLLVCNNKLAHAPISSPRYVLDIGTGTGIWAIEFAEQNPESFVVGTDLSLIQPAPRTTNCQFILENSETQDWLFPYFFDYIHLRFMGPCFSDFSLVLQRAYHHTSPGGWIEFFDSVWELGCIDESARGTALERWFELLSVAGANAGRNMTKGKYFKEYLLQAGYVDIGETVYYVPGSPWAKGKELKIQGKWLGHVMYRAVDSYKKFLLHSGLSPQEIDELSIQVKRDVMNIGIHWYMEGLCVWGRKPFDGEIVQSFQGFV